MYVCAAGQHHGPRDYTLGTQVHRGQPSNTTGRVDEIARALRAAVSLRRKCERLGHFDKPTFCFDVIIVWTLCLSLVVYIQNRRALPVLF